MKVSRRSKTFTSRSLTRARGFSLVELLVVIAIIAVLVGLVLPALSKSRAAARAAVCLSNHRQLVVAWGSYINDFAMFPYGDDPTFKTNEDWGWGGVDWYPATITAPNNIPRTRPLNAYLGVSNHIDAPMDVFRCPLDVGLHEFGTGVDPLALEAAVSVCPTPDTEYGTAGTSYRLNTWMYCKPGSPNGWGGSPSFPNYRTKLGPQHVQVSTSQFVVFQDTGPSNWAVSSPVQMTPALAGEWWHGSNQAVHSFLDGSARAGKATGRNVTSWFSMHMVPLKNPTTWRWPGKP